MKAGMEILVRENLQSLKLSTMVSHLESTLRQRQREVLLQQEYFLQVIRDKSILSFSKKEVWHHMVMKLLFTLITYL
jgi:hypothetical protein